MRCGEVHPSSTAPFHEVYHRVDTSPQEVSQTTGAEHRGISSITQIVDHVEVSPALKAHTEGICPIPEEEALNAIPVVESTGFGDRSPLQADFSREISPARKDRLRDFSVCPKGVSLSPVATVVGTDVEELPLAGADSEGLHLVGADAEELPLMEAESEKNPLVEADSGEPPLVEADSGEPPLVEADSGEPPLVEEDIDEPFLVETAGDDPPMVEADCDETGVDEPPCVEGDDKEAHLVEEDINEQPLVQADVEELPLVERDAEELVGAGFEELPLAPPCLRGVSPALRPSREGSRVLQLGGPEQETLGLAANVGPALSGGYDQACPAPVYIDLDTSSANVARLGDFAHSSTTTLSPTLQTGGYGNYATLNNVYNVDSVQHFQNYEVNMPYVGYHTATAVTGEHSLLEEDTNKAIVTNSIEQQYGYEGDEAKSKLESPLCFASDTALPGNDSGIICAPQLSDELGHFTSSQNNALFVDGIAQAVTEETRELKEGIDIPKPLTLIKSNQDGQWKVVKSKSRRKDNDAGNRSKQSTEKGKKRSKTKQKQRKPAGESARHTCLVCGRVFRQEVTLLMHVVIHNAERPFVCAVCDKTFKRKDHLTRHEGIHSGVKPHECQECGRGFYRPENLRVHLRKSQTPKPVFCIFCDMFFSWKCALALHLNDAHPTQSVDS